MNEPIQEKTTTPPGLLPKHVQSWLILGLAVLMVVIMWLTGGKKQASLPKANASTIQTPLPLEVNETKITDLQNRIQELQREQLAAQSALVQQNRLLGAARCRSASCVARLLLLWVRRSSEQAILLHKSTLSCELLSLKFLNSVL